MFFKVLRRSAFRVVSAFNGLNKEIKDVEFSLAASKIFDEKKIHKLIFEANNFVPYYSEGIKKRKAIEDFPVLNKNDYKKEINRFISKKNSTSSLQKVVTSGSTGTPFVSYQDKRKKIRNTADTICFAKKANYNLGDKLFYIKVWNDINSKGSLKRFLENIVPVQAAKQDFDSVWNLIDDLKSAPVKSIAMLGYASFYDVLVKELEEKSIALSSVKSAIAMSESLSDLTRAKFKDLFNCDLYSRYSNVENGIIAQQISGSANMFLLNTASYYVEILEFTSDNPVNIGELGRIVITDYYNFAMPFIRYDTGDTGSLHFDRESQRWFLKSIEGRKMDLIYDTKGNLVSSFVITNNLWLFPEIVQYQFIQKLEKEYLIKLNCQNNLFQREIELIRLLESIFGSDALVTVEYVNEIPLLASGKRKKVVNLMQKSPSNV